MLRGALPLGDAENLKANEEETRSHTIRLFRAAGDGKMLRMDPHIHQRP
jgi:hypothetical protein